MPDAVVGILRPAELGLLIDWAAAEGWNPGDHDGPAFLSADREGFLGLFVDGELLAAVSAAAYDEGFGFIGLYICRPDQRRKGFGRQVWAAALRRLGNRIVGLDGVVAQQEFYARQGFTTAHRNIRFSGCVPALEPELDSLVEIGADVPAGLVDALLRFDRRCFLADREAFVRTWFRPPHRRTLAHFSAGAIDGYGVIRPCRIGRKIGPLFAANEEVADRLFAALVAPYAGETVTLDIPEPNAPARRLAERHGLAAVFETARMYRGRAMPLPLDRIFGITTLELG